MNDPGASRKSTNVSCVQSLGSNFICLDLSLISASPTAFAPLLFFHLQSRLPPEVNRILYVRNLPFRISAEELYEIFGKYGAVYQIRLGEKNRDTRGTAFVGESSDGINFAFPENLIDNLFSNMILQQSISL